MLTRPEEASHTQVAADISRPCLSTGGVLLSAHNSISNLVLSSAGVFILTRPKTFQIASLQLILSRDRSTVLTWWYAGQERKRSFKLAGEFWVHGSLTWLCKTSRYYFEKKNIGDPPFTCQIRLSATDDAKISADRGDPQKYCLPWANGCKRRSDYFWGEKKLMSNFKCPHIIVQSRPQSSIHTRKRSSGKWSHSQIRSNQIWFEMGRMDEVLLHRCNGLISYSYRIQALRSFMGLSTVMCYLHALIHAWGFTPGVCAFLVQRQSQSCCHYRDMHHVSMFAEFEPSWNKSNHVLQDPLADLKILRVAEQKAHVHLAVELTY